MHTFTVQITDDEYKAFRWLVEDPDKWVENAVRHKVSRAVERIVRDKTKYDPNKLTKREMDDIIANEDLPPATDRSGFIEEITLGKGIRRGIGRRRS